jgi:hypothetical protein
MTTMTLANHLLEIGDQYILIYGLDPSPPIISQISMKL